MKGAPHWGFFNTYNGGGFSVDLAGPVSRISTIINLMADFGWIDKFSRAVFTEMTIFNPNKNLFSRISVCVEFSESGKVKKQIDSQTFQLYNYVGPGAVWNLLSEIAVILFIFIFIKREISKMKKVIFFLIFSSKHFLKDEMRLLHWFLESDGICKNSCGHYSCDNVPNQNLLCKDILKESEHSRRRIHQLPKGCNLE